MASESSSVSNSASASVVPGGFGSGFGDRGSGYGHMSGGGSYGRGSSSRSGSDYGTRHCTHCGGPNHTVEYYYDLYDFPQAHQVALRMLDSVLILLSTIG